MQRPRDPQAQISGPSKLISGGIPAVVVASGGAPGTAPISDAKSAGGLGVAPAPLPMPLPVPGALDISGTELKGKTALEQLNRVFGTGPRDPQSVLAGPHAPPLVAASAIGAAAAAAGPGSIERQALPTVSITSQLSGLVPLPAVPALAAGPSPGPNGSVVQAVPAADGKIVWPVSAVPVPQLAGVIPVPGVPIRSPRSTAQSNRKSKRRQRASMACVTCRRRKIRCEYEEGASACKQCIKHKIECVKAAAAGAQTSRKKVEVPIDVDGHRPRARLADAMNPNKHRQCTRNSWCTRPLLHPGHCREKRLSDAGNSELAKKRRRKRKRRASIATVEGCDNLMLLGSLADAAAAVAKVDTAPLPNLRGASAGAVAVAAAAATGSRTLAGPIPAADVVSGAPPAKRPAPVDDTTGKPKPPAIHNAKATPAVDQKASPSSVADVTAAAAVEKEAGLKDAAPATVPPTKS